MATITKLKKRPASEFSSEQMRQAFEQVQNPKGWKFPINKVVDNPGQKNLACLTEAIIFFTGSVPTISEVGIGRVRIRAAGYYAAIGS